MNSRHIIAIGGTVPGGDNWPIDRYVLAQARVRNPAVCFIPTASGDHEAYVERFHQTFSRYRCRTTHLPFFRRTPDLATLIAAQDVIYVGGGNTKSMLAVWHEWGLPDLLRQAWRRGTVLAGVSAGAICWFETGITDSWAESLRPPPCLGFLPGTACPHLDGELERRPAVHQLVSTGAVPSVLGIEDGVAVHFIGRRLAEVVSAGGGRAYHVRRRGAGTVEIPLPMTRLPVHGRGVASHDPRRIMALNV